MTRLPTDSPSSHPAPERLQKILARAGFGSRRAAEGVIASGRVTVDGVVATLGTRADPDAQRIAVDGTPIRLRPTELTLALHKPAGYVVTANDEQGRTTVYHLLTDAPPNLRYVGRLDQQTEGLLLFTTDGELAHRLTHPRWGVEKVYEATVSRVPNAAALEQLRRGVALDDGPTAPARVEVVRSSADRSVLRIAIHEGRNRQVRRMFDAIGCPATRLVRTAFGPIVLEGLPRAQARELSQAELRALRDAVDLHD
ncbi:MAG: pseudouridine synthase [Chloroflexi bacterium]|nr:pseudouridine synthase [Chloroflexota bacterium]MDA1002013.1 pseudouridine synthase [Chloroflexota bacterium]